MSDMTKPTKLYWVVVDKTKSQSSIAIFNLKLSITDLLTYSLTGVGARRVELGDAMASKKITQRLSKGSRFSILKYPCPRYQGDPLHSEKLG